MHARSWNIRRIPFSSVRPACGRSRSNTGLGRSDFKVDPRLLRRGLIDNGYDELPVTSAHAVVVDSLPPVHKDPFDRILVAQAIVEGIVLLTSDAKDSNTRTLGR
jgi:PIN domain nuclease of toxin-antitoxin system